MQLTKLAHRCENCGHIMEIATNHTRGCKRYCPECSTKPYQVGNAYHINLGEPHRREFKCVEDAAPLVEMDEFGRKPRPWEPVLGFLRRLQGTM